MKKYTDLNALSSYIITWAEFFPAYGVVTKHDRRQIDGYSATIGKSPKTYRKHFPSKLHAVKFLHEFNKKLDKAYTVRLFTDRQFAMSKLSEGYRIPYTRKQWEETYELNTVGKGG